MLHLNLLGKMMKRRNFIKLLAGLPLICSLPVLAKQKAIIYDESIVFDLVSEPKLEAAYISSGGFTLGADNRTPTKAKEYYYFDVKHTENERAEVIAAMKRDKPASYFKRFRGYKAGKKEIDNE